VFAVSWWGSEQVQSAFAHLLTWFLLLAAPRAVFELQGSRRRGGGQGSDADQLRRLTSVPAFLWVGTFGLVTLACLALGVWWSGLV
jgi:Peptidase M50B-like